VPSTVDDQVHAAFRYNQGRVRLVVLSLIATGCFSKPPPPPPVQVQVDAAAGTGDGPSDSPDRSDGPVDSLDGMLCQITDTFSDSGGPPCGTWGSPSGATLQRAGDKLLATPLASGGEAVCNTAGLKSSGAFTIHLDQLGNSLDGHYAIFNASWGTASIGINIYRDSSLDSVNTSCNGSNNTVPYSAVTHRYLRYSMQVQNPDVIVSIVSSDDGLTFATTLKTCTISGVANSLVKFTFGSAVDFAGAASPTSAWDNLVFDCN